MPRSEVRYEPVERGIQRVIRAAHDGREVVKHRIKYADANGEIQFRTIHSHRVKDAREALAEARESVRKGEHVSERALRTRFLDVANRWFESHRGDWKPRTERSYRWTIDSKLAPLHSVQLRNLTYGRVRDFRAQLAAAGLAPSSQKRTMLVLHAICEDARKRKLLAQNPCSDLPKFKQRRPVKHVPTLQQVEALIDRLDSPTPDDVWTYDARWSLVVQTAAYTGLRAGELTGLQVRDFDPFRRSLAVERTVIELPGRFEDGGGLRIGTPKTESSRRLVTGLDDELCERLRLHSSRLSPRDFLFGDRGPDGKPRPLNHGNFYKRVVKRACDELGIDMTFHDLRHFYASLLIDLGYNVVEVQSRLGHSSAAFTLNTYAHLFKEETTDVGGRIAEIRLAARETPDNVARLPRRKGAPPF